MGAHKPRISDSSGTHDRTVVVRTHPNRRTGLLNGANIHVHVIQFAGLAVVTDSVLSPQSVHQFQVFLEPLYPLTLRHFKGIELDFAITHTHTKDKVATRNNVQRGNSLGDVNGVMYVHQQDAKAGGHITCLWH